MKLTITKLFSKERYSEAKKKNYTSLSIKTKEYGDRFLSGFGSKETQNWKEGDVVEVDVTESDKKDKDGKPYLNWKLVKQESPVMVRINQIEFRLAKHDHYLKEVAGFLKEKFPDQKLPEYKGPNFGERVETPEEHAEQIEALKRAEDETMSEIESLESLVQQGHDID